MVQIREKVTGTRVRDSDTRGVAWMFWDMHSEEKLNWVFGAWPFPARWSVTVARGGSGVRVRACTLAFGSNIRAVL